jgi:hypothetical protein
MCFWGPKEEQKKFCSSTPLYIKGGCCKTSPATLLPYTGWGVANKFYIEVTQGCQSSIFLGRVVVLERSLASS